MFIPLLMPIIIYRDIAPIPYIDPIALAKAEKIVENYRNGIPDTRVYDPYTDSLVEKT